MRTITVDLARFTTDGYGTIHGPDVAGLVAGSCVAVTDDEADTFEAEVLAVAPDAVTVRIHWDHVLHRS